MQYTPITSHMTSLTLTLYNTLIELSIWRVQPYIYVCIIVSIFHITCIESIAVKIQYNYNIIHFAYVDPQIFMRRTTVENTSKSNGTLLQ